MKIGIQGRVVCLYTYNTILLEQKESYELNVKVNQIIYVNFTLPNEHFIKSK